MYGVGFHELSEWNITITNLYFLCCIFHFYEIDVIIELKKNLILQKEELHNHSRCIEI